VMSVKIARDGNGDSLGHGYVQMNGAAESMAVIQTLNNTMQWGKTIHVGKFSGSTARKNPETRPWTNLYIRNFPDHFTEKDIVHLFEPFGTMTSVCIRHDEVHQRRFALLNFENVDDAQQAIDALHERKDFRTSIQKMQDAEREKNLGLSVENSHPTYTIEQSHGRCRLELKGSTTGRQDPKKDLLYVQRWQSKQERDAQKAEVKEQRKKEREEKEKWFAERRGRTSVWINFPDDCSEEALKDLFSVYGEVEDVRIRDKDNGQGGIEKNGLVIFVDPDCVKRSIIALHRSTNVKVRTSDGKPMCVTRMDAIYKKKKAPTKEVRDKQKMLKEKWAKDEEERMKEYERRDARKGQNQKIRKTIETKISKKQAKINKKKERPKDQDKWGRPLPRDEIALREAQAEHAKNIGGKFDQKEWIRENTPWREKSAEEKRLRKKERRLENKIDDLQADVRALSKRHSKIGLDYKERNRRIEDLEREIKHTRRDLNIARSDRLHEHRRTEREARNEHARDGEGDHRDRQRHKNDRDLSWGREDRSQGHRDGHRERSNNRNGNHRDRSNNRDGHRDRSNNRNGYHDNRSGTGAASSTRNDGRRVDYDKFNRNQEREKRNGERVRPNPKGGDRPPPLDPMAAFAARSAQEGFGVSGEANGEGGLDSVENNNIETQVKEDTTEVFDQSWWDFKGDDDDEDEPKDDAKDNQQDEFGNVGQHGSSSVRFKRLEPDGNPFATSETLASGDQRMNSPMQKERGRKRKLSVPVDSTEKSRRTFTQSENELKRMKAWERIVHTFTGKDIPGHDTRRPGETNSRFKFRRKMDAVFYWAHLSKEKRIEHWEKAKKARAKTRRKKKNKLLKKNPKKAGEGQQQEEEEDKDPDDLEKVLNWVETGEGLMDEGNEGEEVVMGEGNEGEDVEWKEFEGEGEWEENGGEQEWKEDYEGEGNEEGEGGGGAAAEMNEIDDDEIVGEQVEDWEEEVEAEGEMIEYHDDKSEEFAHDDCIDIDEEEEQQVVSGGNIIDIENNDEWGETGSQQSEAWDDEEEQQVTVQKEQSETLGGGSSLAQRLGTPVEDPAAWANMDWGPS